MRVDGVDVLATNDRGEADAEIDRQLAKRRKPRRGEIELIILRPHP